MSKPYEEYQKSVHFSNPSGVRAICSDCHVPRDWTAKLVRKVQATGELYHHFMGKLSTPEKFEITVDKQQLKAAGRQAAEKGRDAVGEAGKLIKRSGEQLENLDESAPSTRN